MTESRRMGPADVPDELIELAQKNPPPDLTSFATWTRTLLAAVLSEYERQVREKVAEEIEAEREKAREAEGATARDENVINGIVNGLGIALRIARGETS
jgi:hypothetical protein